MHNGKHTFTYIHVRTHHTSPLPEKDTAEAAGGAAGDGTADAPLFIEELGTRFVPSGVEEGVDSGVAIDDEKREMLPLTNLIR